MLLPALSNAQLVVPFDSSFSRKAPLLVLLAVNDHNRLLVCKFNRVVPVVALALRLAFVFVVCKILPSNVNALPVANALVLLAYSTPFAVKDDNPVPPRVVASVPVQPNVSEAAFNKAVDALPPKVSVTLVSSVFVRAAGAFHWGAVPDDPNQRPDAPIANLVNAVPLA